MKLQRSPLEQTWKTLLVAYHTGKEILRDRAYWVLFIISFSVIVCSYFLKFLADPVLLGNGRLLIDLDLAVIHFSGGLMAILIGAGLISREFSNRTIWIILSQPVSQTGFLIGKYLGLLTLLLFFLLIMLGSLAGLLKLAGLACPSGLFLSVLLIYFELWLLGALALFFSTFAPPLLGTLLTIFLFLLGHITPTLKLLASQSDFLPARWGSVVVYHLFPNLTNFDPALPGLSSLPGLTISFTQVALILAYGLGFTALFLFLASLAFKAHREYP